MNGGGGSISSRRIPSWASSAALGSMSCPLTTRTTPAVRARVLQRAPQLTHSACALAAGSFTAPPFFQT